MRTIQFVMPRSLTVCASSLGSTNQSNTHFKALVEVEVEVIKLLSYMLVDYLFQTFFKKIQFFSSNFFYAVS